MLDGKYPVKINSSIAYYFDFKKVYFDLIVRTFVKPLFKIRNDFYI